MLEAASTDSELGIFYRIKRAELLKREVALTAKPRRPLTVVVKDMNHNPLAGAEVFLMAFYDPASGRGKATKTDANGEAVIPDVYEGGLYYPQAILGGFYYENKVIRLLPKAGSKEWNDRIELVMEPANRTQRGKVVYENGRPVEGIAVKADTEPPIAVVTNASGEFVFENLPYSVIWLRVQKGDLFAMTTVDKYTGDVVIKLRRNTAK